MFLESTKTPVVPIVQIINTRFVYFINTFENNLIFKFFYHDMIGLFFYMQLFLMACRLQLLIISYESHLGGFMTTIIKDFKVHLDNDDKLDDLTFRVSTKPGEKYNLQVTAFVNTTQDIYEGEKENGFSEIMTQYSVLTQMGCGLFSVKAIEVKDGKVVITGTSENCGIPNKEYKLNGPLSSHLPKKLGDENGSVVESLREGNELDEVFGTSILSSDLAGGIEGLIGNKAVEYGYIRRGFGLAGGESPQDLGPLGTKGHESDVHRRGGSFGAYHHVKGEVAVISSQPDLPLMNDAMQRNMHQIRYSYERQLTAHPDLEGTVTMSFIISKDGSVKEAKVNSSEWNDLETGQKVNKTLTMRFLRMHFPEPKGGLELATSYTFSFSSPREK